ncbi:MAG: efflux RND transporter periplasmic adaptor subunit [Armatimonadetes bacterium]|nr:efflux RND transporter periplasmic adaptor subunit [Armatimonadota bacterium]
MSDRAPIRPIPVPLRVILAMLVLAGAGTLIVRATRNLRADENGPIRASGIVEARTIEIASEVPGTVLVCEVREGDRVDKDDLIATVAGEASAAEVARAEAAVEAARANLDRAMAALQLQQGIASGDVRRAAAGVSTARARSRDVQSGSRPQEIAAAKANSSQARAAMEAAEARLRQLEAGLRPEEIRQAEASYEAASADVDRARAQLADIEAGARDQEIEQARAQVQKARTAREKARKDYDRVVSMVAQGAMSQQELDRATAAYEAADADLAAAEQALSLVRAGPRPDQVQAARAQLDQALARQRSASEALTLARKGPRQEDIDQARALVRQTRASYESALAQLSLVRAGSRQGAIETARGQVGEAQASLLLARENQRQVDIRKQEAEAAQAQLAQAQAALIAAKANLEKFTVAAPRAGTISEVYVRPGEVVKPGSSLVSLVDFSETWVTVYVPEPLLPRIRLGQPASVLVDGMPDVRFPGTVRHIATEAEFTPKYVQTQEERARTVFAVEVAVDNQDGLLKPGMPADVEFAASAEGQVAP